MVYPFRAAYDHFFPYPERTVKNDYACTQAKNLTGLYAMRSRPPQNSADGAYARHPIRIDAVTPAGTIVFTDTRGAMPTNFLSSLWNDAHWRPATLEEAPCEFLNNQCTLKNRAQAEPCQDAVDKIFRMVQLQHILPAQDPLGDLERQCQLLPKNSGLCTRHVRTLLAHLDRIRVVSQV
jgi:hypothetical protein